VLLTDGLLTNAFPRQPKLWRGSRQALLNIAISGYGLARRGTALPKSLRIPGLF
jgi:hypothetical protein